MVEEEAPVFHQEYVPPPEAVSVVMFPAQIEVLPEMLAVGTEFTVTFAVATLVQPAALVTVTV